MDMDEYEEEDDPVSVMVSTYHKCLDAYLTLSVFNPSLKQGMCLSRWAFVY